MKEVESQEGHHIKGIKVGVFLAEQCLKNLLRLDGEGWELRALGEAWHGSHRRST